MKAIIYRTYGPPDVLILDDIEKPSPHAEELLIAVQASVVNRTDCAMLRARPVIMRLMTGFLRPRRNVLGTVFAGRVEACGAAVTNYVPGDQVYGFDDTGIGAFAQYLTVRADGKLARIPDGTSPREAAAIIEGAHYAHNFLSKVSIRPGMSALVNGATGAIGAAMIQMLHDRDVRVLGVCRAEHFELVRSLGAERTLDYLSEDFTAMSETFDFVFDAVGKSTFGRCRSLLVPRGVYISSELGPWMQNLFYAAFTPPFRRRTVRFPIPVDVPRSLAAVADLLGRNSLSAVIDRSYGLADTAEAFRYVETGQKVGNVVIDISS